ncbi:unnamed protein product [Pleuronectes platessa]|uniref:Uncharacterized protein n=1 Tax=Pleuronectes platessa TaxID=8262 RepID=A0A9N7VFW4_PLEPL|nr:unnamed protein product [Pleuronectes platessa]
MGVDGSQRIGAALPPRFGVASASGVNPASDGSCHSNKQATWIILMNLRTFWTGRSCSKKTKIEHSVKPSSKSAARRQPRRIAGRGTRRQRRVPPAGAVADVTREKGPTRVQSRCHLPPYQFPSNRSPPTTPATDTAPREKEEKESPRTSEDPKKKR